jgi:hypothetical protein
MSDHSSMQWKIWVRNGLFGSRALWRKDISKLARGSARGSFAAPQHFVAVPTSNSGSAFSANAVLVVRSLKGIPGRCSLRRYAAAG